MGAPSAGLSWLLIFLSQSFDWIFFLFFHVSSLFIFRFLELPNITAVFSPYPLLCFCFSGLPSDHCTGVGKMKMPIFASVLGKSLPTGQVRSPGMQTPERYLGLVGVRKRIN